VATERTLTLVDAGSVQSGDGTDLPRTRTIVGETVPLTLELQPGARIVEVTQLPFRFSDHATSITKVTPLTITTTTLSDVTESSPMQAQLAASGGNGSYAWSVVAGALPAGLSMDAAGLITGTPTTQETANFTVQCVSSNKTATRALALVVNAATGLAVSYVRRDNTVDRLADHPEPIPVGLTESRYAHAQAAGGGTGLTPLDPVNSLTSVNQGSAAGVDWNLWGEFPVGQALIALGHGTATEHLRFITKAGETPAILRGGSSGGSVNVHWSGAAHQYQWLEDLNLEGRRANSGGGTYPILMDYASNCWVVSCRSHQGSSGGFRGLAASNITFWGFESFKHGSFGNGGDCINFSPDAAGNPTHDMTVVLFYLKIAGHAAIQQQDFTTAAQNCNNFTYQYGVYENPHAGGFNSHQHFYNTLASQLVAQNIGTDVVPSSGSIGSKVGLFCVGHEFSYRHIRMRNIKREGVKFQASNHLGIRECFQGHVYHVTGDRIGREGLYIVQDSAGNAAVDLAQNLAQNCFFTNTNLDETSFSGGGGNGASGKWTPLTYAAFGATSAQWADANRWDSGAALSQIYAENSVFCGMTRDTITGWTLESGSIYRASTPNKFAITEDPDSPELTGNLTNRESYVGEMVFEGGSTMTRRTSLGAVVGAGEFYHDDTAGILYVWATGSVDPTTLVMQYGRDPGQVDFMAFNPISGTPGGWVNYTLASAESTFTELANNVHDVTFGYANGEIAVVSKSATWGYDGVSQPDLASFLVPDDAQGTGYRDVGVTTLGKTAISITEFNISADAGSGEPGVGYYDSAPDAGAVEVEA